MRFTVVFEQNGRRLAVYPYEIEDQGELEKSISDACLRLRREHGTSLFDGVMIRIERDE